MELTEKHRDYWHRNVSVTAILLVIYVIIIGYYARYMNRLDREYDVHEGEED